VSHPVHFEILTEHPEEMAEFYRQALGWRISAGGGSDPYWLAETGSEDAPGINGALMGRRFPQAVINTVEVSSLAETIRRIEAAGGRKVHGPGEIPGAGMHAYCADPDGNLFGLLERAPGGG
jgi:predicted enzyme related to lactoylglutathione lyase